MGRHLGGREKDVPACCMKLWKKVLIRCTIRLLPSTKMHATSKIAVMLLLAAGMSLSAQTEQNPAPCDGSALSQARALQQQRMPNTAGHILALYQEALRCSGSQAPEIKGDIWLNIGRLQATLSHPEDAYKSFSSALAIFQQIGTPSPEIQLQQAKVLLNLAIVLQGMGYSDEALQHFNEARQLFHNLSDKDGEAYTLSELGRTSFLIGDNEAALDYYGRTTTLRNSMDGDSNERLKAATLDLLGRVHARMNQDGLAEPYFWQALSQARQTSYHRFIAYTLNDLGALQLRQKQPELAEQSHLDAQNELQQYEAEDSNGIAETLALLADAEMALGKQALAQENYHAALSLQQQSGDVIGQAQTLYSLGLIGSSANSPESRLEFLEHAVDLFHRAHHREGESQARFQLAKLLLARDDYENASKQVTQAIQLAEEIRNFTPGRAQRTGYFTSVEKMYRFEIDLLLNRHSPAGQRDRLLAFDLMQRSQARALVDALQLRRSSAALADSSGALEGGESLLQELQAKNQKLQWLLQINAKPQLLEQTFNIIQRLETSVDEMEAEAEKRNPNLKVFSPRVSISVSEVQQRILDDQSALIQFYLGEPSSYAWVITASSVDLIQLPPRKELEQDIQTVLAFDSDNAWTSHQQAALRDFRHKFAPLFALTGPKRWIIVPDGPLHNFPVSLLFDSSSQSHGEVVEIPSLMAISASREAPRPSPPYLLALFADPVFDRLDSRVSGAKNRQPFRQHASQAENIDRGQSFSRLVYSRSEMQQISLFVPHKKSRIFKDFAAQASAASGQELKDFKIIHLATHSVRDGDHPELSRIVFSLVSRDGNPKTPGFLMLKDIYRMKLSSDLVVLSSCRGASGQQQPGEGPMSLSRAFLFAGSRAVVAPLWEVDDEVTAELMGRFYRYMFRDKLPPVSALKKTQDDFRHHPNARLRNPYYWAGFELYGDWMGW